MGRLNLQSKREVNEEEGDKHSSTLQFVLSNLPINRFKLEEEAVKQVELMQAISKLLPKAKEVALRAKNNLEIIEADLAKEIRKNPKKYGLDKTSDAVVYKETKTRPEYKKAFSSYLFAKTKEDEYSIILNNIQERGRMVKILVELYLNGYYVTPNTYVTKSRRPKRVGE